MREISFCIEESPSFFMLLIGNLLIHKSDFLFIQINQNVIFACKKNAIKIFPTICGLLLDGYYLNSWFTVGR
jgi:hypothetical protein